MALRNQPYIPLYVQDFLTDEKLIECSAASTGVYIRLMCIMHKSEEYGTILLKQKDKQTPNFAKNFASKLAKHMPYDKEEIDSSLKELIDLGVIQWKGDKLLQKRMIKDNLLSITRSKAGKKGGFATQFAKAKTEASTEYEYESESEVKKTTIFKPPTVEEIKAYCKERKNKINPESFFDFYESKGWMVGKNKMKNWQAAVRNWEKSERTQEKGSFQSPPSVKQPPNPLYKKPSKENQDELGKLMQETRQEMKLG